MSKGSSSSDCLIIQQLFLLFCNHFRGYMNGSDTDNCNLRKNEINITRGMNKCSVGLLEGEGLGKAQFKSHLFKDRMRYR